MLLITMKLSVSATQLFQLMKSIFRSGKKAILYGYAEVERNYLWAIIVPFGDASARLSTGLRINSGPPRTFFI
jgi:hypothetical protein